MCLSGTRLDYWVAQAEGLGPEIKEESSDGPVVVHKVGVRVRFHPSGLWQDGGPIIERERIMVAWNKDHWIAGVADFVDEREGRIVQGPTALVAAMRAYVLSRFGDRVEEPGPPPTDF